MSHDLSGNSSLTRNSSIDQEKSTLHIENSELNSDDTESLVRLGALYRLHSSTGERTITAGAIIPTRKHNLAELQAANSSLDKGYYNAGSRAQTVPLSYNLRNASREGQDSPILIPQYLPSPSSSISTPSYPNYMSISTSSSFKQASTSTYSPRTRPSNDTFAQATKNSHIVNEIKGQHDLRQIYQSDIHTNQQTSHGLINRGTTGTVIPETDILYSSSDEDDAVRAYGEEKYGSNLALDHEKEEAEVSSSEDIDDPEYLELCERGEIVDKYDKGPDSKDVDPWENPDFELYKVTDRYGFIHKNSPPTDAGKDAKERERKRDQKWYRMVLEWNKRFPVKLKERIWKGVPDKLRSDVWQRLLGSKELKLAAGTNTYRELLMRAKLISKDIKQIDLDINRTYRDNLAFRRRYDVKQRSLFNVLSAYAMYNTEVGYCQGMSQIAALFLLYMDEEEAFWCLHSLMVEKKFTMHGFFVPGFPKLHRFQDHYEKILQKYLPRLKKHFDKFGIPPIYLTKWWFGCFLDRVPFSLALRIWDIFIFQGDSILLAMSYNIMKMHQKTIRKFQMENFMEFIQNGIAQDFGYPSDKVMESLEDCLRRLQSDKMDQPPPPPAGAPSEVPTKPLGPVLSRSMINIEMDIAEIQSRCSRANSLAGTPSMTRHQHSKKSAARTPKMAHSLQSTIEHRLENIHGRNNEWHVNSKKSPSTELGYDKVLPNINNMHIVPSHSKKSHEFGENFNRQKDTITITDNRRSYYDNVPTPSMSIPDDESQAMFPRMQRPAEGSSFHGNVGIEPIHRTPIKYTNQNITYIAVGDDDHAMLPSYQEVIRGNHSSSVYVSDSRSTSFSQSMQPNRKNYEQIERL